MTKEWAIKKLEERREEIKNAKEHIMSLLRSLTPKKQYEEEFKESLKEIEESDYCLGATALLTVFYAEEEDARTFVDKYNLKEDLELLNSAYWYDNDNNNPYDRFVDSPTMHFDGDIIITDPCYVMRKEEKDFSTYPNFSDFCKYTSAKDYPDYDERIKTSPTYEIESLRYEKAMDKWRKDNETDWERCECGENLEVLGLNAITHDTIYGDWSCTVLNTNRKKPNKIGSFCADAGLVSVFDREEVKKYNPDFEKDYVNNGCACIIENFVGDVTIKVEEIPYKDGVEYEAKVVGMGYNKLTKRPIKFESTQSGF